MEATTELETLADFFDQYGSALTAGDLPTIAACYRLPGTVVSGNYSFTFSTPAAVALSFVGAQSAYQESRVVAAHADIEEMHRISQGLVMVAVRWEYLDCDGGALAGDRFRYILQLGAQGPQICVVMPLD